MGVSDEMTPGDITNLGRSSQLAFRVSFTGEAPAHEDLYWRGLVLDFFDGRTWRRAGSTLQTYQMITRFPTDFRGVPLGEPVSYDVILEPTQQSWVYALQLAEVSARDMVQDRNYSLITEQPINQRYRYQVSSYLQHQTDLQLAGTQRARSLQIPEGDLNPRTAALAAELRAAAATDMDYAVAVLRHFREQPYYYTLTPPALGDASIDEFMFTTREGFCGHYAGSFVYMMREAGIPARVVVGYQGGEYNPFEDYTLVYQYNAHAWAEVWIEGEGWVRFDPTAAVAPERITLGVESFFQDQPGFMEDAGFSMMRFRDTQWLNTLRLRLEGLDYAWNRWVVSYDENMQMELLGDWFGDNARQGLLIALGSTIALFFVFAGWFLLRHGQGTRHDPATRVYLSLLNELARSGVPRRRGEGPVDYCGRVASERPDLAADLREVTDLYVRLAYLERPIAADVKDAGNSTLASLRQASRQLRRRLMTPLRRVLLACGLVS
jgi:transglutaminase-like putative cysteine protease